MKNNSIFATHPAPIWIVNQMTALVVASNPSACRLTGNSAAAMEGVAPIDLGIDLMTRQMRLNAAVPRGAQVADLEVEDTIWEGEQALAVMVIIKFATDTDADAARILSRYSLLSNALAVCGFAVIEYEVSTGNLHYSPEALKLLGLSANASTPDYSQLMSMAFPDDVAGMKNELEAYQTNRKAFRRDGFLLDQSFRIVRADGEVRRIRMVSGTTQNRDLRISILQNIAASEYLSGQERRAELLLKLASESAQFGGWQIDGSTGEVEVTSGVLKAFDLQSSDRFSVETALQCFNDHDRAKMEQALQDAINFRQPFDLVLPITTQLGRDSWLRVWHKPDPNEPRRIIGFSHDITEVVQLRDQIAAQSSQISSVIENMPTAFFLLNTEQEFTYINEAAKAMVAIGPRVSGDLIGRKLFDCWPELEATLAKPLADMLQGGPAFVHDMYFPDVDLHIKSFMHATTDGFAAHVHDTSAEALAKSALAISTERYRLALDASKDVIFDWDVVQDKVIWSDASKACFGFDPTIFPRSIADVRSIIHPNDLAAFDESLILGASEHQPNWALYYRLIRADGSIAFVEQRGRSILNEAGQIQRQIGTLSDTTELRDYETKLRLGMSATSDVIYFLDSETGVNWWSDNILTHYGHAPKAGQAMVAQWRALIHPEDIETVLGSLFTAIANGAADWQGEYRFRHMAGHYVHIRDRARFYRDQSGKHLRTMGSMIDITEAHRESKVRELETQVLDLVSGGAELCQVMSLIMSYIDMLIEDCHSTMVLVDGAKLRWITPPNLPSNFCIGKPDQDTNQNLIDGIWGMAIAALAPIVIEDFENAEIWRKDCSDAQGSGMKSCWGVAIRDANGISLGSIIVFSPLLGSPKVEDVELVERIGRFGRVAIERTSTMNDLRNSEERYRLALQAVSDVVFDWDIENDVLNWSDSACLRFGYAAADLPTNKAKFLALLHPKDQMRMQKETQQDLMKAGRQKWTTSYDLRLADGCYATISESAQLICEANGERLRMIGTMTDVTQLMREQERQQALAGISNDAVLEYDPTTGSFIYGKGFKEVFGIDLFGEFPNGGGLLPHFHPDDLDLAETGFHDFVDSGGTAMTLEYRLRRGDGSFATVQERIFVLHDENGKARRAFSAILDISELRLSEELFRIAAVASQEVVFDLDLKTDRLTWTSDNQEHYGYDTSVFPLTMQAWLNRVHPEDRERMSQSFDSLKTDEARPVLDSISYRFLRADGSTAYVLGRGLTLRNQLGQPIRQVGMMFDVTALHDEEERLRAVVEIASDAVYEYDIDRERMIYSDGVKTCFGHDWIGEQEIPSPWQQMVHPEDIDRILVDFMAFVAGPEKRWYGTYRMKRGDGTWAHVEDYCVAIRDQVGRTVRVIGRFNDVTEQHRLEEQLHTAQKMESIGRISGGIAHDFNNLLAVVMGNAELIAEISVEQKDSDEIQDFCKEIIDACVRGAELTRRLLSFARKSRLAPVALNINDTVTGMSRLINRAVPERIQIHTTLLAGLWQAKADPAFLESALLNLVINARDAIPNGGALTIETSNLLVNESYVEVRDEEMLSGRYVMLAVSDTGIGIARENLEKVIEPFFSTKPAHLGSGLGLAMVHGFVKQSGGALRIYSEVGVGTTIKILLPALANASQKVTARIVEPMHLSLENIARILLVEDEAAVRKIVSRILEGRGYAVTEAENGDAAFLIFQDDPNGFDVLLTDVVMPGVLQGPALATQCKKLRPDLGIIFMSGYANEAAIHGNGLRPEDYFLMKPVQRADLLRFIDKAIPSVLE